MKKRRWLFSTLSFSLLAVGLYTGDSIFYAGFGILTVLAIYATLTSLWVLFDFHYLQIVTPPEVSKGDDATLTIQIHNDKPFIFPYIKIYYQNPINTLTDTTSEGVLSILPFQHGELKKAFTCTLRGQYFLGITRIEVSDIFGLFMFSMTLTEKSYHKLQKLTVYPRILDLNNFPLPKNQEEGAINRKLLKTEETATLSDIRQYRYGDPMKKIHWKLSSKLQEIKIMNYEIPTQPYTLLYIDTAPPSVEGLTKYQLEDQIVEIATSISHHILYKWLPLQLVTYSKKREVLTGQSPQDFQTFFKLLCNMTFESSFSMTEIIHLDTALLNHQASILLILHSLNYDLYNNLCTLKYSNIDPMVFLVQHRSIKNIEQNKMIEELNAKGIPSYIVYTDQRLDEYLEVIS